MSLHKKISRREFVRLAGLTATGALLGACGPSSTPAAEQPATQAPAQAAATTTPVPAATAAPAVVGNGKVRIAVGGWAEQNMKDLLAKTDFTKKTGIDVEVVLRTDTKETELTRLASAVQAGNSPYDVIDFEDELTTSFSQAGYVLGLDDLLPADFWDDFSPAMKAYSDVWSANKGETFRIIHNWEMPCPSPLRVRRRARGGG
jgi:ABC-type glycerol-3-phosphate transport system substrate-binding protein